MRTMEERFWEKVEKSDGCWLWTGSTISGYGYLHSGDKLVRKPLRAHRASWAIHHGPIPDGLWVLHHCDTPLCVRPDHLFLGDRRANMLDAARKGRICTVGKSRLTHCKRGHEFTKENTRTNHKGHRWCITCLHTYRARVAAESAAAPSGKEAPNAG